MLKTLILQSFYRREREYINEIKDTGIGIAKEDIAKV
jgi:hypothetical protein